VEQFCPPSVEDDEAIRGPDGAQDFIAQPDLSDPASCFYDANPLRKQPTSHSSVKQVVGHGPQPDEFLGGWFLQDAIKPPFTITPSFLR
jgi:hypothetical protein